MGLKEDVAKIQEKADKLSEQEDSRKSIAYEILQDFKKQNKIIAFLLFLSLIANIVIVLLMR